MKEFNTTGLCVPNKHYMVDTTDKINEIGRMERFLFPILYLKLHCMIIFHLCLPARDGETMVRRTSF